MRTSRRSVLLGLAASVVALSSARAYQWSRSTEVYANADNSKQPLVMFGNSYTNVFLGPDSYALPSFQWGRFATYDLKPLGVTADAKWADIGGILIITGAADLFLAFRAPGSTTIPNWQYYQEQLLSAATYLGERSVNYDTVPLVNGCFEAAVMALKYPDDGAPPAAGDGIHSVGWNVSLKKWGR